MLVQREEWLGWRVQAVETVEIKPGALSRGREEEAHYSFDDDVVVSAVRYSSMEGQEEEWPWSTLASQRRCCGMAEAALGYWFWF